MKKIFFLSIGFLLASTTSAIDHHTIDYMNKAIYSQNVPAISYKLRQHDVSNFTSKQKKSLLKYARKVQKDTQNKISILTSLTDLANMITGSTIGIASFALAGVTLASCHPYLEKSFGSSRLATKLENMSDRIFNKNQLEEDILVSKLARKGMEFINNSSLADGLCKVANIPWHERFMSQIRPNVLKLAAPIAGISSIIGLIALHTAYEGLTLSYAKEQHQKACTIYNQLVEFFDC